MIFYNLETLIMNLTFLMLIICLTLREVIEQQIFDGSRSTVGYNKKGRVISSNRLTIYPYSYVDGQNNY